MRFLIALCLCAWGLAPAARAQEAYPNRPVTIVVGFPPGTATDTVARLLSDSFTQAFAGVRFVVENRPGQSGSIGAASVVRATPDGYTIFVGASAPLVINPHIFPGLRYDSRTDFAPIGQIVQLPYVMVAGKETPFRTMADVVEAARAKPDEVTYASTGNGTTSHLLMSMLSHATGARMAHIPYRGTAQSITDIIAGRVSVTLDTMAGTMPFVNDGMVRALAITTDRRSSLMPNVPTTAEAGFPVIRGGAWLGMFAPAGTPPAIVNRLNDALRTALKDERTLSTLRAVGTEPDPTSPEEMGAILRADHARWGEIVRVTGVRVE